jgi:amino acid permease
MQFFQEIYGSINTEEYDDDAKHLEISSHNFGEEEEDCKENRSLYNSATWFSCYVSLTSTVIGAGILGIPFAFSNAGWIFGTLTLLFGALTSGFGLYLLSLCAVDIAPPSSFYIVADKAIPGYSFIIDIVIALKCLSIATAYLIVIGDSLPLALQQLHFSAYVSERSFCILFSFFFYGPISYFSTLDALKLTSFISGLMIIYLALLIFIYSTTMLDACIDFKNKNDCVGETDLFLLNYNTMKILPIFFFGYSCQQNAFTIVNELKNPTQTRVNSVFIAAMVTAFIVYTTIAFSGYATFGNHMQADILKMYPSNLFIFFVLTIKN